MDKVSVRLAQLQNDVGRCNATAADSLLAHFVQVPDLRQRR
ncbi:hypothetical protein [Streptomyces kaniharaensis]|nr:hypothetical protein [Streptomyces kaniharaensis]